MTGSVRNWLKKLPATTKVAGLDATVMIIASLCAIARMTSPLPTPGGTTKLPGFASAASKTELKTFSNLETHTPDGQQDTNTGMPAYRASLSTQGSQKNNPSSDAPGQLAHQNTNIPEPPAAKEESKPIRTMAESVKDLTL